jgi:hypothetical protein
MKQNFTILLILVGLAVVSLSFQEPSAKPQEPAAIQNPEDMDPMELMAAMMAIGQPGEPHQELMAMAGNWETKIKMKMAPDAPWEEYTGKSKIQKALGGRYVIEKFSAEMGIMGKFEGLLILGYNNLTEEYESIWMDNFSTSPTKAAGSINEGGTMIMKGLMKDLITPDGRPYRHETTPKGKDTYMMQMFDTIPPVGDVMVMEIEYTRVK